MKKADRQKKIREIITDNSIERQEDLVKRLNDLGLQVTQATISRDIKEMQLVKIPAEGAATVMVCPPASIMMMPASWGRPCMTVSWN